MYAVELYHRLPGSLRTIAASMHGYRLMSLRYGGEVEKRIAQALLRERWSKMEWETWHTSRLLEILARARYDVPFYRRYWDARTTEAGSNPDVWKTLSSWPVLTKHELRKHNEDFVSRNGSRNRLIEESTSGTTGTPIRLWFDKTAIREWYALYELRVRGWLGLTRDDRWGIIGAKRVVAPSRRSPPFWVWNQGMHQLYMSAFHLAPWSAKHYLDAIGKHKLRYLLGYSNSIAYLAREVLDAGKHLSLEAVITNGEPVTPAQRAVISEAFHCPVRETYGLSEEVAGATECEMGRMHLWPDAGIIELLDEHQHAVPYGETGRVVATGLLNSTMPLIRYDVGDLASIEAGGGHCACGRTLPLLKKVLGRSDDVVVTKDGRQLVQFDGIFDPAFPLKEGQIIQKELERFVIRVVPDKEWNTEYAARLAAELVGRIGPADVTVETVDHIERTWAGKFRVIISELASPDSRQS